MSTTGGKSAPRRREVIGAVLAAAASPAVAQPAAPPTPGVEFAFEVIAQLAASQTPGQTPYGGRNLIPITGGSFEGPRIRGKVLSGGGDWQLIRPDGVVILEADYMMQTDDGALIRVHNRGVVSGAGGPPDRAYVRCSPIFEAPIGPHDWLNKAVFVGTVQPTGQPLTAVRIRVFKVI